MGVVLGGLGAVACNHAREGPATCALIGESRRPQLSSFGHEFEIRAGSIA